MNNKEMKIFHEFRITEVLNNRISKSLESDNGIILHSIPYELLNHSSIDWINKDQANCPKLAFRRFSDAQIEYYSLEDGYIGITDREYTIWFDNGIIETFTSPLVMQTEIPNAPVVSYILVESILMHSRNFMNAFLDTYEKCYNNPLKSSIFISLIGVKNIFFNSRVQNYTTTSPYPNNVLTFPIVENVNIDRNRLWGNLSNIIHSTLIQLNAIG